MKAPKKNKKKSNPTYVDNYLLYGGIHVRAQVRGYVMHRYTKENTIVNLCVTVPH
jgi:hypothetical protein